MRYLGLVKYTAEACAQIAKDGLASRRASLAVGAESQGGTLDEFWAVDSFDWNVAFIFSVPDDQPGAVRVAQFIVSYGVGHLENTMVLPLVDAGEADNAMTSFLAPQAPGAT